MNKLSFMLPSLFLGLSIVGCDPGNPGDADGLEVEELAVDSEADFDDLEAPLDDGEEHAAVDPGFGGDLVAEPDVYEVGFPTGSCRAGFSNTGPANSRICVSGVRASTQYLMAQRLCRSSLARVCSREDYFYVYSAGPNDGLYNPDGQWLGNTVGDDAALCGNRSITYNNDPDMWNFDGTCNVGESHEYRCCHDDDI